MSVKSIFQKALPFITAAASGPPALALMAATAVGQALGSSNIAPTIEGVTEAIAVATAKDPEAMVKLKQVEMDFQLKMKELGFDSEAKLEEIAAADRANARFREISLRDNIPALLAIFVTAGFFGLLTLLVFKSIPDSTNEILFIMVGSLGSAWIGIITYYFGSSANSARKTELMAKGK